MPQTLQELLHGVTPEMADEPQAYKCSHHMPVAFAAFEALALHANPSFL